MQDYYKLIRGHVSKIVGEEKADEIITEVRREKLSILEKALEYVNEDQRITLWRQLLNFHKRFPIYKKNQIYHVFRKRNLFRIYFKNIKKREDFLNFLKDDHLPQKTNFRKSLSTFEELEDPFLYDKIPSKDHIFLVLNYLEDDEASDNFWLYLHSYKIPAKEGYLKHYKEIFDEEEYSNN